MSLFIETLQSSKVQTPSLTIEIMDPNKKFLYFNADSNVTNGTEVSATTVPVGASAGMEVTEADNFRMYFKESVETDTLDVTMSRTANSDPREIMESIVNQINYSKEPTLVIGDDSTGEFADHRLSALSLSFADRTIIKFQGGIQSNIGFANGAGGKGPARASNVGKVNSEIISTFLIDLAQSGSESLGSADEHDVIGQSGSGGAYFTQITKAINGIVYRGEMICVEEPLGANAAIGLAHNGSSTLSQNDLIAGSHIIDDVTQTLGKRISFTANIAENRYLYLFHGASGSANTYTAGKFLVRLFGADDVSL